MSLLRSRSFALRKLIVNGRFCSRRLIGLLVAAISVTAMLLTSASSVKTAPLRVSPAPIAAPGTNEQPTPERGAGQPALSWRNLRRPNIPVSPGTWIAEGPGPIQNGQAVAAPNNGVAGAIKAIAAHPSNPDILYVGTVNGGVWKTTNAVAASPTWTPLTDNEKSLSIGALKFDPTDAASNTLIAGIGRFSSLNSVGGPRSGLLLTTDGGITWSALDGGGVLAGANISGVAARGSIILAGVDRAEHNACVNIGIFRSENTGTSFTRISGAARSGLPFGSVLDLAEEPTGIIPHGVVMTSDGTGGVQEWSNNGNFINTIQTLKMQDAGSAFDAAGNFYVTDFGAEGVTAFDPRGRLIGQVGQAPGYKLPESIVQDGAGHFFIGNAGDGYLDPTTPFTEKCKQDSTQPNYPPCPVYEFDPTFTSLIRTFLPDTEKRGTDWTAIANDQCTMLYTSEGTSIKAFNVCSGTQLADFTTGLPGPNAYELGISPTGEVFVADADEVVRLNSHGRVIQRYTGIGGTQKQPLFAMRFDPDGSSIWTANLITSDVYKLAKGFALDIPASAAAQAIRAGRCME